MAKTTIFSALSRAPWWLSLVIAAALFVGLSAALPGVIAAGATLPFLGIACYAAWRQWRSARDGGEALESLRELSSDQFSARLVQGFRRDGFEVTPLRGAQADFELRRDGRLTLVASRRWKAAHSGIAPLKELAAAREAREADECFFVASGELSPQARTFAAQHRVQVVEGAALARLFR